MTLELVLFLVLPVLFLATCALMRVNFSGAAKVKLVPLKLFFNTLLVGSVFGHDFFHVSVITFDRMLLGALWLLFAWQFLFHRQELTRLNYVDAVVIWLAGRMITFSTFTADYTIMDSGPLSRLLFFNYLPVILYFLIRWVRLEAADLKVFASVMVVFGVYLALTAVAETRGLASISISNIYRNV